MKAVVFTAYWTRANLLSKAGRGKLRRDWRTQFVEYERCNSVGLVYVLLTQGYQGVLAAEDPWIKLDIERRVRDILEQAIEDVGTSKIRIVGVDELIPTMASLERIANNRGTPLCEFLLGKGQYLYYDSPKMVEALIRIARRMNRNELIFRFDSDVTPNEEGIQELINYYRNLPEDMRAGYYLFSGGYFYHDPPDFLNDYAVRTYHLADRRDSTFALNESLAKKWIDSMEEVGADPYNQVISGAGLCMSVDAIETLPPFANMGELIIWIDDYLKRVLHEGLGQLPSPSSTRAKDTSYRRCSGANFKQERYRAGIQRKHMKEAPGYLGRLVRGSIMDALIKGPYKGIVDQWVQRRVSVDTPAFRRRLRPAAKKRLQAIIDIWGQQCYQGYPLHAFATRQLRKNGQQYIDEAINNLDVYRELIKIWPECVSLFRQISRSDPDNAWLFLEPV